MIKTKSVYYDKIEPSDGLRILVMRQWPRGAGWKKNRINQWIKELGPSKELLDAWNKKRIGFSEYEKRYFKEAQLQINKIKELAQLSERKAITLLCHEKSDTECHRRLLKELIEQI